MSFDKYFSKNIFTDQLLFDPVPNDLGLIIVVPCFNEPNLRPTIDALLKCTPTNKTTELIIVVNSSESNYLKTLDNNNNVIKTINECFTNSSFIKPYVIHSPLLNKKDAGVGLARKIGMDEAARRHLKAGNKNGGIVCFDADSTCATNYLVEIENAFKSKINGCSIHFEHPLTESNTTEHIIDYEIHLRYYKNMLKFCQFPYPYHTIGSSMATSTEAYLKQGGMNKKKAGEDFYFLHRIFLLNNFKEITTTSTFPSPRISDRVPFGTGRAMMESISGNKKINTYHPNGFIALKKLYNNIKEAYSLAYAQWDEFLPLELITFFNEAKLDLQLEKLQQKKLPFKQFKNQLYTFFDGFKLLKFLHFYRDNYQENITVLEAGNELMNLLNLQKTNNKLDLLTKLRSIDKSAS